MNIKYTGGPAFPVSEHVREDGMTIPAAFTGMTLRDYFAAQVITGHGISHRMGEHALHAIAENAYGIADAMLAARGKGLTTDPEGATV